jgi:superfamily I DNA and/or RNA helicase
MPSSNYQYGPINEYFDELERWLALEGEAERQRLSRRRQIRSQADVERTGETLVRLQLRDHRTGLAGRLLLDFAKPRDEPLPMNRLKVGSPVVVSDDRDPADHGIAGVVSKRRGDSIQVATEAWPEGNSFRIDLSPDETTRRRQLAAMTRARQLTGSRARLRDALLGKRPLRYDESTADSLEFQTSLNLSQQDAVRFALAAKDAAVIHGPPGTGKTTTVAEIIVQAVARGDRVLACAPSNTAVDNLLERLVKLRRNALRVGHPARVFEELRDHTLDERVDQDPSNDVIREMKREIQSLIRAAERGTRSSDARRRRRELFAEVGVLRGQIRTLERSVIQSVLDSAEVICTTTTIDDDLLGDREFDLVVIDEACQATLPSVWPAILRANRLILAGDHCQLPPTVLSEEAAAAGMRESLMQHLVEREGHDVFRRLTVQYRMHRTIMNFSSKTFYDGELVADRSVADHLLCDLPGVMHSPATEHPVEFIDTAGAEFGEEVEADGESKFNLREARLVARLTHDLLESGVAPEQIGVIAPYAAQVRLLRSLIESSSVEIDTVDGFQGREKEAILLSMVRSNDQGEIGFLADTRRTNVAMTRAKRKLLVVGDSATLGNHPFYASMLEYFESAGHYRSVWEFGEVD